MQERNGNTPTQRIGTTVLVVTMDVDPEDEAEFNKWYNEQHLPERMEIPGYVSARRFKLEEGEGALKYLCIWELEDGSPLQSQMYKEQQADPTALYQRVNKTISPHSGPLPSDIPRDWLLRGPLRLPPPPPGGFGITRIIGWQANHKGDGLRICSHDQPCHSVRWQHHLGSLHGCPVTV